MGVTSFDNTTLDAVAGRVKTGTAANRPTTPAAYYGAGVVGYDEFRGGELYYATDTDKLYVQSATSGKTATWYILDTAFATSTTSSTTSSTSSTSSSSSTSTSTSSTSSTSSSSSSTSSSSTTTMA